MGIISVSLILLVFFVLVAVGIILLSVTMEAYGQGQPPPIPDPCTGNPTPESITVFSAEVLDSNTVRLQWEQSKCSTEFQIQRQSYIGENPVGFGTIFTADRDFDLEFITRIPPNNSVFFFLDTANSDQRFDYRILAKTVVNEAPDFSPVVTVFMPPAGTSRTMASVGFLVQSPTITPILIDYIEGTTPLQNLLFEYLKSFDVISLFIQWAFAHHGIDLFTFDPDPQNQAVLFFIEPTPTPTPNQSCQPLLEIIYTNDQSGGQTINYTVTLLDYPTIIHQETYNSGMANRNHIKGFFVDESEELLITDYSNIYVQINAQGESVSPPNDRSLIIHEITFLVPEDQNAC